MGKRAISICTTAAAACHRRRLLPLPRPLLQTRPPPLLSALQTAGSSFYRPQSCFSRDLAVLSAVVQRRQRQQQQLSQEVSGSSSDGAAPTRSPAPSLHVLDLMAGSGIRSMRYLLQAGADHGEDGLLLHLQVLAAAL